MQKSDRRALDHLVLPTVDLSIARERLASLGFTVAPEGVHPFGTANVCVYFADETFLESLAVADPAVADEAAANGNVFVARDRAFRAARGDEGFSAVVLASTDADADHAAFVEAGSSAGQRLDFSRGYTDAQGAARTVSFRLALAAPDSEPDAFFFTCERVDAPAGGRGALAVHPNGVTGISRVVAIADEPARFSPFFSTFVGSDPVSDTGGVSVGSGRGSISVLTPQTGADLLGLEPKRANGLVLHAIIFTVSDLATVAQSLRSGGIGFEHHDRMIVVPASPGQGAVFAFEVHA
ncbi:VOC family protein [Mesorhizobium sp. CAU 1732]|uniref:VOC family protein n=1 Tax=Mesorhizobium sp. CAU 1732 TaxID=3140358 RepID=UPI0032606078